MSADDDRLARLRGALATLPERSRQVYLLHARNEVPLSDIAARLGIDPADVEAHLAHALATLTELFDDPPP